VVRMDIDGATTSVSSDHCSATVTQNLPVLAHQTLNSATFDNKTPAYNFTGQCLSAPFDPTICGPISGSAAFPVIPSNGILPYFGVLP